MAQNRSQAAGTGFQSKSLISLPQSRYCAKAGVRFRNDIVTGFGGKQILAEDPSGNPIELFEPILPEARLKSSK
jgi:hypothetical protein